MVHGSDANHYTSMMMLGLGLYLEVFYEGPHGRIADRLNLQEF